MTFEKLRCLLWLAFIPILLGLNSCEKFSGDQEVPAYLTIDSIYVTTDNTTEGSASHNITDAWVYVDDNLVGAFQLPAKFPVLAKGTHTVKIQPGIKKDGISTTRTNYVFYSTIKQTVKLAEDSITSLGTLHTTYTDATEFYLIEDFDGIALSFDTTSSSEADLQVTPTGSGLAFEGSHSGMIVMDTAGMYFECVSNDYFTIPYATVYMELNYNTNNEFTAGVYTYGGSTISQRAVVIMNPTNGKWKKIYIDLTNALNAIVGMEKFSVFLSATQDDDLDTAKILIDNLKILSRPSTVK